LASTGWKQDAYIHRNRVGLLPPAALQALLNQRLLRINHARLFYGPPPGLFRISPNLTIFLIPTSILLVHQGRWVLVFHPRPLGGLKRTVFKRNSSMSSSCHRFCETYSPPFESTVISPRVLPGSDCRKLGHNGRRIEAIHRFPYIFWH